MNVKQIVAFIAVITVTTGVQTAYGSEITEETSLAFLSEFTIPQKEDATLLTLEEAIEKAVKNSTALKTANLNLELSEKKTDRAASTFINSVSGESLSNLLNLIKQNASYSNSLISQKIQQESLKYSMKKTYIEILNMERSVVLQKMNAKSSEKELTIARTKAKLGLISEKELSDQELSYQSTQAEIQSKEKALEEAYATLNTLIGNKNGTIYQIALEPQYEELALDIPIESYASSRASTDLNIQKLEREVDVAESQLKVASADLTSGIDSEQEAENNVATAQMNLNDSKRSLVNSITSCYNSILQAETAYNNSLKELENLKKAYEISQNEYKMGLITENEMEKSKQQVAEKESTLIGQIYEHMLLIEQFENTYLLS